MQKRALVVCAAAAAAALSLLLTCSKSSNPSGPGEVNSTTTETYSYTTLGGNTIVVSFPQKIYSGSYCNGSAVISYHDTVPAFDDTMFYYFSGDSLFVGNGWALIRAGSGSGLTGRWDMVHWDQGGPDMVDISASTVIATFYNCHGTDFMAYNSSYIASHYTHVSVAQLGCNTVRLTGSTTGEVVTLTWDSDGNMTYSSSDSLHASKIVYENPATCPNNPPDWYNLFLTGNSAPGPVAKAIAPPAVGKKSHTWR